MKNSEREINLSSAQRAAMATSRRTGAVLRANLRKPKQASEVSQHDIKLELDSHCQQCIEADLRKRFPHVSVLGEEGSSGRTESRYRWVIDPIDGTVNYTFGIPHACISIALQERRPGDADAYEDGYSTLLGVVYDPFRGEMWTALRGRSAFLNGQEVRVSDNKKLSDAIVAVGFAKAAVNIAKMTTYIAQLAPRVRKIRIFGSAALDLAYLASGRIDAYVEPGLRLWDIVAGGLIVEAAGGEFWHKPLRGAYAYQVIGTNGRLRKALKVA
jgi:myo-inositol-1(or 4)-monophosphatase